MKINIVCTEEDENSILIKFSHKLKNELIKLNHDVKISSEGDALFEINHFVYYYSFDGIKRGVQTFMITHIRDSNRIDFLNRNSKNFSLGICMSKYTRDFLLKKNMDPRKLSYILPAQENLLRIKKKIITITSNRYNDGRKREYIVKEIIQKINPKYFKFIIMGNGWQEFIDENNINKLEIEIFENFHFELYKNIMNKTDIYLYVGFDEGSMGVLDAACSGLKILTTYQGFHTELKNTDIIYGKSSKDFISYLVKIEKIAEESERISNSWTWENYCKKHIEIWNYLLYNQSSRSQFVDGLSSTFEFRKDLSKYYQLVFSLINRFYRIIIYKMYNFLPNSFINLYRVNYKKKSKDYINRY
jgi:hypothetical protein